jgi:hypothetical protein
VGEEPIFALHIKSVHSVYLKGIWKNSPVPGSLWLRMKPNLLSALLILLAACAVGTSAANIPFLQDDFAKARAEAIKRKLPVFVECWAPW